MAAFRCALTTTTLSTNPAAPNGTNGWFVSPTTITLTSSKPGTSYYQWDTNSGAWSTYAGPINAPEGTHALYYYSVDEAGNRETTQHKAINLDRTAPTAPTSLKATVTAALLLFTQSINLSWSGASDNMGVSSYVVQRSTNGKSWTNVATVNAPTTSYTDTNIAPLTLYHYRVFATDAAGNISTNASPAALIMTLVAVK